MELKNFTQGSMTIPYFVWKSYPLYKKDFSTTILTSSDEKNKKYTEGLIKFLKTVNPDPIIMYQGNTDFYPHYKNYCINLSKNPEYTCTFYFDFREHLPSEMDLVYMFKLYGLPIHFIIIGHYDTLPRLFLTNSQIIYFESIKEFNALTKTYQIENMMEEIFLLYDKTEMHLLVWISKKEDIKKYIT
jgi:hypothetical protein